MIGVVLLIAALILVGYAIREDRASARRWERHEKARAEWLADPTNLDLYQKWLRT